MAISKTRTLAATALHVISQLDDENDECKDTGIQGTPRSK